MQMYLKSLAALNRRDDMLSEAYRAVTMRQKGNQADMQPVLQTIYGLAVIRELEYFAERPTTHAAAAVPPGEALITRAGIAAATGDRERAMELIRDAYRARHEWRRVLHLTPPFMAPRGYATIDDLVGPND